MTDQLKISWENMLSRLSDWLNIIVTNLPNFMLALLVFSISFWVSGYVQKWINKSLSNFIKQTSVRSLVSNVVAIVITALGFFLALGIMNLDTILKSLLAGAGVAGLAVGLALQGTLSNTFSGVSLALKDTFNIGNFIETNNISGTVEEIGLNFTKIRTSDNNITIIPNKIILDSPIKNYSLTKRVKVEIECGVGYEHNLERVKTLSINTIQKIISEKNDETIEFHYLEFGDSSINFQIRYWVEGDRNLNMLEARSEGIIALKAAFDRESINIPFPIRTIHIDGNNAAQFSDSKDIDNETNHVNHRPKKIKKAAPQQS